MERVQHSSLPGCPFFYDYPENFGICTPSSLQLFRWLKEFTADWVSPIIVSGIACFPSACSLRPYLCQRLERLFQVHHIQVSDQRKRSWPRRQTANRLLQAGVPHGEVQAGRGQRGRDGTPFMREEPCENRCPWWLQQFAWLGFDGFVPFREF